LESLAALKAGIHPEGGTRDSRFFFHRSLTVIASCIIVMSAGARKALGLEPMRLSFHGGFAGVDPAIHGL